MLRAIGALTRAHAPGRTFYSWPARYYGAVADLRWFWEVLGPTIDRAPAWWSGESLLTVPLVTDMLRSLRRAYDEVSGYYRPEAPEYQWRRYPPEIDTRAAIVTNEDTVATLVEFAKADQREDFDWLAAASGVSLDDRAVLWDGTRRRLGKS